VSFLFCCRGGPLRIRLWTIIRAKDYKKPQHKIWSVHGTTDCLLFKLLNSIFNLYR
jgi:hypothetical protein